MPELPDLQAFSKNLTKKLSGRCLEKINIVFKGKLKTPETTIKKAIEKHTLEKVGREGKELRFFFDNGNVIGLHLMLKGELKLLKEDDEKKYMIAALKFDNDSTLAITDFQKLAHISLNPQPGKGIDALSKEMNEAYLKQKLQRTKSAIKNLLMDQKVIRGIGNAYADEILWDAGISPFSASNKIPDHKIKALAKSIKTVLTEAEKQILKSNPDLITGEVRDFLKIHNARKQKSPGGAPIQHKIVGGRKTYYTHEQKLYQ